MRPAWSTHLQPRANNQTTGRIPLKPRIALTLALSTLAAACAAPGGSGERANGYAVDGRSPVVKSAYNICWRTGYWTPAAATVECDPDLAPRPKPAAAPPAPIAAAPVPAVPIPAPAPPPPPVAVTPPPPPPPPVPVAAPAPPPKPKRCDATITLQSDQTFGFGSATLTPGARTRIDSEVLPRLQGCASVDLILVSGHTDRIGAHGSHRLAAIQPKAFRAARECGQPVHGVKGCPRRQDRHDRHGQDCPRRILPRHAQPGGAASMPCTESSRRNRNQRARQIGPAD